ncbi:MAG TPA: N-glycosylase/DNA lyase [Pseudothermotoga sp.]|nr:N-glycosylase/DNA lyase [Pseudothermotoga sp.]HOK83635.1 N-glycosylase/DNA lyase [Pseudothermotoga sp.]HPP69274.1 N-glycosylase/DNA lyase [Pseudothermotoga sp.]
MQIPLLDDLRQIKDQAQKLVEDRFREFKLLGENGSEEDLFSELCFCVLTANWSAQGGIKAQQVIGKEGFLTLEQDDLELSLARLGHRYPTARASYIIKNRDLFGNLRSVIKMDPFVAREWLAKNALGIGFKEASHFLRNVGVEELAILDRHVLSLMNKHGIINELPKSITKSRYLLYEDRLRKVANDFGEPLGKFDLYLWYLVKGKVEK